MPLTLLLPCLALPLPLPEFNLPSLALIGLCLALPCLAFSLSCPKIRVLSCLCHVDSGHGNLVLLVTGTEEKIGLNEADNDCCLHAAEDFVFLLQNRSFSTILPSSIMSVFHLSFGLVIFEVFAFLLYHLSEFNHVFYLLFGLVIFITWVLHHLSEFNYVYVPFLLVYLSLLPGLGFI